MSTSSPDPSMMAVKTFIEEEILNGQKEKFDEKMDLIEKGAIDSMSLLRLISFIEQNCQISVPDEDMLPENFRSLAAIRSFVARRQGASESRTN
jgi:acyl carrier protein